MNFLKIITSASIVVLAASAHAEKATLEERSLFNGKDLTGWTGQGYVIEEGAITCTPKGRNLITEETFSNYILSFDFKLTPGANNGLGIHYPGEGDGAYTGFEIQVLDNTAEKYKDLKDYQFHGGLYTLKAAKKGFLKPVGEWNSQTVTIAGDHVKIVLNGEEILEANLLELSREYPKHAGVKRRAGHIAWLGHGDKVFYKNIHITELPPILDEVKLKQEGFSQIFDEKTLCNFKTAAEMTNWIARNGVIKHDGQKGEIDHLWTEKSYKDFTIQLDWRWSGRGEKRMRPVIQADGSTKGEIEIEELDSGVILRGDDKSQVNIWNWSVGSGEVFGYRNSKKSSPEIRAGATPNEKADKPLGEWNRFIITMQGDRLSVSLNGKKVIQNTQLPGVPETGPIGFQTHGSRIDFANIWIKEL